MLRQLNMQLPGSPKHILPVSISLLLHALFLAMIVLAYKPKMPEFFTVELSAMPQQQAAPRSAPKTPSREYAAAVAASVPPQAVEKRGERSEPVKETGNSASALQKTAFAEPAASSGGNRSASTNKSAAAVTKTAAATSAPVAGIFGSSDGPAFIRAVQPVYPGMARRLGKEGTVLLRITLDEHGTLLKVVLVEKAGSGFDEAAINAVKASRFRGARQHGRAVGSTALLPVKFKLEE